MAKMTLPKNQENILEGWQKKEGVMASSALQQLLNEQTGRQRKAYSREWEHHETLGGLMMNSAPSTKGLIESIHSLRSPQNNRIIAKKELADQVYDHQYDIMSGHTADRLSIRIKPFDVTWTDFQPSGARGTAAHGPGVGINGFMSLDLTETYVDRPVAYGGWMTNAAGVGAWFKPKSTSTYVRVAPFVEYQYNWKDESNLQVAHNSGEIGVFIQRFLGPGRFETILDSRKSLWKDGTGWFEEHDDEQSGYFVDSNYFWGNSNDWYLVWIWCNSSINFATKTTIGSSKADNFLVAKLRWLVFEQWA